MRHNRLIQFVAYGVTIASVVGASLLYDPIIRQRRGMIITDNRALDAAERVPPSIALATAFFGPLRALIINVLWYRAQELQQAGQYYEAYTLSQWLTRLLPRAPKVWDFHSWNMAYNISVAVNTPEERWDWVSKGVHMLRNEAIPLNPKAIYLYKQLSWIFFHKIGGSTDDMHWYYKRLFVQDWNELLGSLPPSTPTDEVIANFRTIAEAPAALSEVRVMSPEAGALFDALARLGIEPGQPMARQIGKVRMFRDSPMVQLILSDKTQADLPEPLYRDDVARLLEDPKLAPGIEPLLAYCRKRALEVDYHMDTQFMLDLMLENGPLDWRHPMSHGTYWAAKGMEVAGGLSSRRNLDLLNTLRNKIHNLQEKTWQGVIIFDPVQARFDSNYVPMFQPDPRMIRQYDEAIDDGRLQLADLPVYKPGETEEGYRERARDSFRDGHENFLQAAVRDTYLYGETETAQKYLDKLRRDFLDEKTSPNNREIYTLPLEQAVWKMITDEGGFIKGGYNNVNQLVLAMLTRGIVDGLAQGRHEVFDRHLLIARQAHAAHQATADPLPLAPQERRALPPFDQILNGTMGRILLNRNVSPMMRSRIWFNAPPKVKLAIDDTIRGPLVEELTPLGLDPDAAFPAPEGLEQYRRDLKGKLEAGSRIED